VQLVNTRLKGFEAADIPGRSGAGLLFIVGEFFGRYYPYKVPRSVQFVTELPLNAAGKLAVIYHFA
jgi:acyl-CoA synthetase (AMP-forming)/AMP-acid ligase II